MIEVWKFAFNIQILDIDLKHDVSAWLVKSMQKSGQHWYERLKGPGKMSIDM